MIVKVAIIRTIIIITISSIIILITMSGNRFTYYTLHVVHFISIFNQHPDAQDPFVSPCGQDNSMLLLSVHFESQNLWAFSPLLLVLLPSTIFFAHVREAFPELYSKVYAICSLLKSYFFFIVLSDR